MCPFISINASWARHLKESNGGDRYPNMLRLKGQSIHCERTEEVLLLSGWQQGRALRKGLALTGGLETGVGNLQGSSSVFCCEDVGRICV